MDLDDIKEELEHISQEDAEALGGELDGTKEQLRQEFEAFMMEKFLAGKDSRLTFVLLFSVLYRFFDYQDVDSNERLDDTDKIRDNDEEERWFDED